ncbi:gamma-glutamylcyclotransferase [Deinococcus seoulensis]|uniref:Putative gamma-glutamylcyclotransferase n=2 Tax=Deinococcus TaxID=1298 RepID=A0ABQ2S0A2_9DEIO|nr:MULTISPECIES: gamma-glutamylcyclotransferase family protein [Deinococcus]GGR74851.1 gamma-glutamylcyclotransferase [Deinococcus seoulensis]GGS43100.1 gamma-glutamylcyclotransferase [Deinococcus knuensis]
MTTPTPDPRAVFVYGTLMPGERNAHVARRGGPFSAQEASLGGHDLLHLHPEGYPALRPSAAPPGTQAPVRGYLLTYTPQAWAAALPFLDHLEGLHEHPPLYRREQVKVVTLDGQSRPAWVYLYAREDRLRGAQLLPGGDWRAVPDRDRPGSDER